ncbi:hypothetical protein PSACC_00371 [Paramicrosporidium saccamoebae]|uniref:Uncharacterized protein n=1 Tax=Paramicrosporidium saccamoebae TaxID=1246581 RepID=A0A2H9TQ30_9FUNG|nr:hypothetical protein PSACC_00371 [Paramicrosporidium saccamoebae]
METTEDYTETAEDGYPRFLSDPQEMEVLMAEQLDGYSIHAKARRERVLAMLNDPKKMLYATLATGTSLETLRIKLMRLLDPARSDLPEDEARDFELLMACGMPPERIPAYLLD